MNTLTWVLYLSEVLVSLGGFLSTVSFLGMLAWFFCQMVKPPKEGILEFPFYGVVKDGFTYKKVPVVLMAIMALTVLIPSKQTMLMMVGSELTEATVTSELGQEVLGELKEVFDVQMEKLKETK